MDGVDRRAPRSEKRSWGPEIVSGCLALLDTASCNVSTPFPSRPGHKKDIVHTSPGARCERRVIWVRVLYNTQRDEGVSSSALRAGLTGFGLSSFLYIDPSARNIFLSYHRIVPNYSVW